MAYRILQYQIKAEPVPLGAAERSSPDKWQNEMPDLAVRRTVSVALLSSIAFVPLVSTAPTPVYITAQSCEPIKLECVQYQANAEPVLVPTTAPETVTSDKWAIRSEQPRQDIRRQQFTHQTFFAERLHVAPATLLYVSAQSCEPIAITHFQYPSEARPVFTPTAAPETITLDKWLNYLPGPTFKPKRLIQYGVNIAVAEQADDGLPPAYWLPLSNTPKRTQVRLVDTQATVSPLLTSFGETITLIKWIESTQEPRRGLAERRCVFQVTDAQAPNVGVHLDRWSGARVDPLFRPRRTTDYGPFTTDPAPPTEPISLDKWNTQRAEPFRLFRLRDYISFVIDSGLLTQAERAQPDKWDQPQSVPKWDLRRQQYGFPILAIDSQFYLVPPSEPVRLDKWNRQHPDLVFRAKRLADYSQFTIDPTLRAETITLDKWYSDGIPLAPAPRRLILTAGDVVLTPESFSLDKWSPTVPHPRVSMARPVYPELVLLFVSESVTLDKWLSHQVLTAGLPRSIYIANESVLMSPAVPLFTETTQPIFAKPRAQFGNLELLAELRFEQWRELVQPFMPRGYFRQQYLYPFYKSGTDSSITIGDGIVIEVPSSARVIEVEPNGRIIRVPAKGRIIQV